ncbi:MBL fold metallo-hydrolase [Peribacillus aracenensis]|uniref:MBL fold metallo-hydrolase n=1 Tax=Peribacillus aracenensis TaxID=2976708 RepID=UPI0021A68DA8|nr:MBL fold metallo-hydrolase [Peribacillus sp. BBB004]
MLTKITDVVYQVKNPIPIRMKYVNCYLIKGKNGYTIIDTGYNTEETKALWTRILSDGIPVEKVVLTHAHPDHVGLAGWFQHQLHVPIWMSKKSYTELRKIQSFILNPNLNPIFSFLSVHGGPEVPERGFQRRLEDYDFEPDLLFEDCSEIKLGDLMFEAIWTPGHSPDHFSFYNRREKILFVGDHVLNSINSIVLTEQHGDNSLKEYFNSLARIDGYKALYVLPGHGERIDNLAGRITDMRVHYRKKWEKIKGLIHKEGSTAYEVSQNVYGNRRITDRVSAAPFLQTITNLTYMDSIGCIRKEERQGVIYFLP